MSAQFDISSLIDEILNTPAGSGTPFITTPVEPEKPTVVAAAPAPTPAPANILDELADAPAPVPTLVIPPKKMPEFTTAELVESTDIRKFATLVILKTARWRAKVNGPQGENTTADAFKAQRGAYESYKHLLAGCDAKLKLVTKAI